jgi:hypothetical protein
LAFVSVASLTVAVAVNVASERAVAAYDAENTYVIRAAAGAAPLTVGRVQDFEDRHQADVSVAWLAPSSREEYHDFGGRAVVGPVALASPDLFEALGVTLRIGRTEPGYVLSHSTWQGRFGGALALGTPGRVEGFDADDSGNFVGVLPPGCCLQLSYPALRIVPAREEQRLRRARYSVVAIVTSRTLTGEALSRLIRAEMSVDGPASAVEVVSLRSFLLGRLDSMLRLVTAGGVMGFLVALLGLLQMQAARDFAGSREWATRSALGATRGRIAGHVFLRSATTVALGLLFVLPAAAWALKLVDTSGTQPADVVLAQLTWPSTALVAVGSALALFGILTSLGVPRAWRHAVSNRSREGLAGSVRHRRIAVGVAALEVALAVAAVYGSAFLASSMAEVTRHDDDLATEGVFVGIWRQPLGKDLTEVTHYPTVRFHRVGLDLVSDLAAHPQLDRSGAVFPIPYGEPQGPRRYTPLPGPRVASKNEATFVETEQSRAALQFIVGGRALDVLGIELVRGRLLTDDDRIQPVALLDDFETPRQPPPILVSESLAQAAWPSGDAVGQYLALQYQPYASFEVVGVVSDAHHFGVDTETLEAVYVPFGWSPVDRIGLLATGIQRAAVPSALVDAASRHEGYGALAGVDTLEGLRHANRRADSAVLWLFSLVMSLCLLAATAAAYSAVGLQLSLRARESAIRLALGATSTNLTRYVSGLVAIIVGGGLLAGMVIVAGLSSQLTTATATVPDTTGLLVGSGAAALVVAALASVPHMLRLRRLNLWPLLKTG